MDRESKRQPLLSTPRDYIRIRYSPDGRRLAVNFPDGKNRDIWVYNLEREALSRLTFNEGTDRAPVWTPDGTGDAERPDRGQQFTCSQFLVARR